MGLRSKLKKITKKARSITDKVTPHQYDKINREMDRGFLQVTEQQQTSHDPLGTYVHKERTRTGGELNDNPLEEDPVEEEIVAATPPQELVDEEAARKARRRSRARQRSGRSSTILTGGGDLGGDSGSLGGG